MPWLLRLQSEFGACISGSAKAAGSSVRSTVNPWPTTDSGGEPPVVDVWSVLQAASRPRGSMRTEHAVHVLPAFLVSAGSPAMTLVRCAAVLASISLRMALAVRAESFDRMAAAASASMTAICWAAASGRICE